MRTRVFHMPSLTPAHWATGIVAVISAAAAIGIWSESISRHRDLERRASAMTGGDPKRGLALTKINGCPGCHEIPGVRGAEGTVGPPLTSISRRVYIGVLLNTPEHMIQWLRDPPSIDPKTPMPNVGLSENEARDVAAFLYTLD
jgi:cytochrome c